MIEKMSRKQLQALYRSGDISAEDKKAVEKILIDQVGEALMKNAFEENPDFNPWAGPNL